MFKVMMIVSVSLAIFSSPSFAGQSGNGGGGVLRNGIYMTFGSAGLWTNPIEKKQMEVPHLDSLIERILSMDCFSVKEKSRLFWALAPSAKRKYYDAIDSEFDQKTKDRLIAEYSRIIHAPAEKLVLFAITDTKSGRTYLLPEFYQLKETEQMAILFHEAFWILYPKSTYDQVIRAEVVMQRYLENPELVSNIADLVSVLPRSIFDRVYSAAKIDAKNGVENGITSINQSSLSFKSNDFIFGAEFHSCIQEQLREVQRNFSDCEFLIQRHWANLKKTRSDSAAISLLAESIQNHGFYIHNIESRGSTGSSKPSNTDRVSCSRFGSAELLECYAISGYEDGDWSVDIYLSE